MNIYEMYVANGNKAGFWIQRNSWTATIALVKSIGGITEGVLPGEPPYHGNIKVVADVYNKFTGALQRMQGFESKDAVISCPGTYGYYWIDPPLWTIEE